MKEYIGSANAATMQYVDHAIAADRKSKTAKGAEQEKPEHHQKLIISKFIHRASVIIEPLALSVITKRFTL